MSNERHIGHIGELAVALGIGLAAAPAGVAYAAPADSDSGTSSTVDSTDDTTAGDSRSDRTSSRESTNRNSDTDSADTASTREDSTSASTGDDSTSTEVTDDTTSTTESTSTTDESDSGSDESASNSGSGGGAVTTPGDSSVDPQVPSTGVDPVPSTGGDQPSTGAPAYSAETLEDSGAAGTRSDRSTGPEGHASTPTATVGTSGPERSHSTDTGIPDSRVTSPDDAQAVPARPPQPATASASTLTPGPGPGQAAPAARPVMPGMPAPDALLVPASDARTTSAAADISPRLTRGSLESNMQTLAAAVPTRAAVVDTATRIVSNVLGALGLRPNVSGNPVTPVESPMFWALAAAWCGKQEKAAVTTATTRGTAGALETTGQPVEPFAGLTARTFASSVTATEPVVGVPNRDTGVVLGTVTGSGSRPSYAVTGQPGRGSATVNASTGAFTYTPSSAARQSAALDPSGDYDTFTVTVTSGQTTTPVTVRVPVSAARMQVMQSTTVGTGTAPTGVAIAGDKTYVANQATKTVSVLNATNAVIATVPVGTTPTGVAANPAGTRVYVTNKGSNSVSVVNTSTNKVVATVGTGLGSAPTAVAVNPAGTRAYVTNSGTNSVSIINTSTNTVIGTIKTGIGTAPSAVAVNPTLARAYVTNSGSNTVSIVNTSTNTVIGTVATGTGTSPNAVAVNPAGTRVYVTNSGSNSVSIIDTATNTLIGTVGIGARPTAVRVSADGSALYVVTDSDRLTVIDTATRTVVSDVGIDTSAETGAHAIALSADGTRILVTDAADAMVRTVSLAHVNSAPTATWTADAPQAVDGAVTITMTNPSDPDGDPVTFTSGPAGSGSVVADGTGVFVYTPTAAARDLVLKSQGPDADQFTITVGDGQAVTNLHVTVPISPSATGDVIAVDHPTDATVAGDRIYVVSEDGFVRVIDGSTGEFVGDPIAVDWASTTIAADPNGNRVYVDSPWSGTVSVIDTTTGSVVDTIWVSTPTEMAVSHEMVVSPDGTRLYSAGQDGTVSVIDTTTGSVVDTRSLGYFTDLDISADGRYLYGTSGTTVISDAATVSVIDTATMTTVVTTTLGPDWNHTATLGEYADTTHSAAVDASGTRLYVTYHVSTVERAYDAGGWTFFDGEGRRWRITGGYGVVSVIDIDPNSATYGDEITTTRLSGDAHDLVLSRDGRHAFVTAGDGRTVSVIDTSTNTVVGTFETDPNGSPASPIRSVLISADRLYVTDYHDGAVYSVSGLPLGQPEILAV